MREDASYFIDSVRLSGAALERKHCLENDPTSRTDVMAYASDMERIDSDVREKVLSAAAEYDPAAYSAADCYKKQHQHGHQKCGFKKFHLFPLLV